MRLLLIEDDPDIYRTLQRDLVNAGYLVDIATDGEQGEFLGATEPYHAAIVDLGLPKCSGIEVLRSWRKAGNTIPVIILTARDTWLEIVDGFNAGADDYLGKPFHFNVLLVRLQALLKRVHRCNQTVLQMEGIELNEENQTVLAGNTGTFQLTATEFRLLRYFMLNRGKLLTKSQLTEQIYNDSSEPDSNVLEVYVKRLRKMIGSELIQTRRNQGYIFGAPQ